MISGTTGVGVGVGIGIDDDVDQPPPPHPNPGGGGGKTNPKLLLILSCASPKIIIVNPVIEGAAHIGDPLTVPIFATSGIYCVVWVYPTAYTPL